jgi:hypothetical protein
MRRLLIAINVFLHDVAKHGGRERERERALLSKFLHR